MCRGIIRNKSGEQDDVSENGDKSGEQDDHDASENERVRRLCVCLFRR